MNRRYAVSEPGNIDSPALLVFPEIVAGNIREAIAMIGDPARLMPHVKTNKTIEATKLMMDAGISRFKCATIAEAEMLGICGAAEVLLAYQPFGPKIDRLLALAQQYPNTQFGCCVDNEFTAIAISEKFAKQQLRVNIYIDLNTGMNRTGIEPAKAVELYLRIHGLAGISLKGLHAYDGHIRGAHVADRKVVCDTGFAIVQQVAQHVRDAMVEDPVIIAGGSPTFPIHCTRPGIICSPGTFVFWDKGYTDACPEQAFTPAAILMTRVISRPAQGLICVDLGHKSISAENAIERRVFFPDNPDLEPVSQSEEHLVLKTTMPDRYEVGDVLFGIPFHVCPTVALYDHAISVEKGVVSGAWKIIARDRRINI